jgi:hypothetical protein
MKDNKERSEGASIDRKRVQVTASDCKWLRVTLPELQHEDFLEFMSVPRGEQLVCA